MDGSTDRRVALISIHPKFATAILNGEKLVEFRRRAPSSATSHVIVYATAPVRQIVGWFRVESYETEAPAVLWDRFGHVGGIESESFQRYFGDCELGTAMCVAEAGPIEPPASIQSAGVGASPPQSFRYVEWATFEALRRSHPSSPASTKDAALTT